jgi:GMP synthase (glutamine-hydrolysing)
MHDGEISVGREYGSTVVHLGTPDPLLEGFMEPVNEWMSHGLAVARKPPGWQIISYTSEIPVAGASNPVKKLWGLQWHPEVSHSEKGFKVIENFVYGICGCKPGKIPDVTFQDLTHNIKRMVRDSKAIVALGSGLESLVTACIAQRALHERVTGVHIEHELQPSQTFEVIRDYLENIGIPIVTVKSDGRFLEKLKSVIDPEEKRWKVGEEYSRILEEVADDYGAEYLIQGTVYPEVVESGCVSFSQLIKTHHNLLPSLLPSSLKVVNPLGELYRDEVKRIGVQLGLPEHLTSLKPSFGFGTAFRIIGEVSSKKIDILRQANDILTEEVERSRVDNLWQCFAVLTDTFSTGVKGDERTYGYTVAVRMMESLDAMTANFYHAPWSLLESISTRITNEIPQVTRVVYDISNKPPSTIEWE